MSSTDTAVAIIWNTIAKELSDLPDLEQATRVVFKLVLAALLGGLLGFEREASGKSAGLCTHMLVAMGAAMFMTIALLLGVTPQESSRVIQGVIESVDIPEKVDIIISEWMVRRAPRRALPRLPRGCCGARCRGP